MHMMPQREAGQGEAVCSGWGVADLEWNPSVREDRGDHGPN